MFFISIRNIIQHPHDVLRKKAIQVTRFDDRLHKLLEDMFDTMHDARGVGLAAPQVGISKQVLVVDIGDNNPVELINPKIIEPSKEIEVGEEACLSIPGYAGEVKRHKKLKILAQNRYGKEIEIIAEDFFARALQHEIDHLNGVLYIDLANKVYERSLTE